MESEVRKFKKYSKMDPSHNNGLPTLGHFLDAEKRDTNSIPTHKDDNPVGREGFTEMPFHCYFSYSVRNARSKATKLENGIDTKRGSMYQSSKEAIRTKILDSVENSSAEPYPSDGFIGMCFDSDSTERQSAKALGVEGGMVPSLQRSCSARWEMPYFPSSSESNQSNRASLRAPFKHIRKKFDPFLNSNRQQNPLVAEPGNGKTTGKERLSKERMFRKSSPAHLQGRLSVETENGFPILKFTLDLPDDVYVAKAWKFTNELHYVYTFHYIGSRKNRNSSEQGLKGRGKGSSMVGQMQVSGNVCWEPKDDENSETSAVTEFLLYDTAHAWRSNFSQQNLTQSTDVENSSNRTKPGSVIGNCRSDDGSGGSNDSNPWPASDLHPGLELGAIIMEEPVEQRESLGYKKEMTISGKNLKVVVPIGNHGLPSKGNVFPLTLLQRWRLGCGCDCGGWDMGCPLFVLSNPDIQFTEDRPLMDHQHFLELFLQGAKESLPAFTMALVKEGQYQVDFHAQLSALQAFSICVSVLHSAEVSRKERRIIQLSRCMSLKELIDKEAKPVSEPVMEEQRIDHRTAKGIQPSFLPDLEFSPFARV